MNKTASIFIAGMNFGWAFNALGNYHPIETMLLCLLCGLSLYLGKEEDN